MHLYETHIPVADEQLDMVELGNTEPVHRQHLQTPNGHAPLPGLPRGCESRNDTRRRVSSR